MNYQVVAEDGAKDSFFRLDRGVQTRIAKKLAQLERPEFVSRHLRHGKPHYVAEVGGYRIAYLQDDKNMERRVVFIGMHKEYERWYSLP
ncbi:MAG: hypothetical protein V1728_03365 [Candidatus Micrarchaeota archaeon]